MYLNVIGIQELLGNSIIIKDSEKSYNKWSWYFPNLLDSRINLFISLILIYTHILGNTAVDLIILEISLCKLDNAFKVERLKSSIIPEGLFKEWC